MKTKFNYYDGDIYNSYCLGTVTIGQFINSHKNPKESIIKLFDKIEKAAKEGNLKLKNELKKKLYYFTPAVIIEKDKNRKYANILEFTGLAQLDFDKLESTQKAEEFKQYLFNTYPSIICAYLSPSRLGVKALINIPKVDNIYHFKEYYKGIEEEMKQYDGFDIAPKNAVLPLFLSRDTRILYRDDYNTWDIKGNIEVDYVHLNESAKEFIPGSEGVKYLQTINLFKQKIDAINGNGHPQLMSATLVLGSRAGAGYIDISEAETLAEYCVSNNSYLKKKFKTYMKTVIWCLKQGYNNPKYY